jgi:hypothetical protein
MRACTRSDRMHISARAGFWQSPYALLPGIGALVGMIALGVTACAAPASAATVSDGTAVLHVVVTGKDGYISDTASGLTSLFGFPPRPQRSGSVGSTGSPARPSTRTLRPSSRCTRSRVCSRRARALPCPPSDRITCSSGRAPPRAPRPKLNNTLSIAKGNNLPVLETSTDAAARRSRRALPSGGRQSTVVVHTLAGGSTVAASKITG